MLTVRAHNEGSLFQRKTGPYKGQWVASVTMRSGRRASRVAHDRDGAKAELAELIRLRDARAPITRKISLGAYLERWVNEPHGWAPATLRRHRQIVKLQLVPELGGFRLSELSVADVSAALAGLGRAGLDSRTVAHVRATLRRCLADAVRDGLIARNAAGLATGPKVPYRERATLDAGQARQLIDSTRGTRYGPLWTVLVTTGLRISEALGLAWSDIDFGGNDGLGALAQDRGLARTEDEGRSGLPRVDRGVQRRHLVHALLESGAGHRGGGPNLTVRHTLQRIDGEWQWRPPKTAKGRRTIPLTPLAVDALRAQREQQRADLAGRPEPVDALVFLTERGGKIHATNLLPRLYADLKAAGLPRVTLHDLRHSCATLLYSMGVPLETISDILGHSTTRITADLYRHRVGELQRAAADKMQEALG